MEVKQTTVVYLFRRFNCSVEVVAPFVTIVGAHLVGNWRKFECLSCRLGGQPVPRMQLSPPVFCLILRLWDPNQKGFPRMSHPLRDLATKHWLTWRFSLRTIFVYYLKIPLKTPNQQSGWTAKQNHWPIKTPIRKAQENYETSGVPSFILSSDIPRTAV